MHDLRKLDVWVVAHRTTHAASAARATFPEDERFGLSSQLRRAASAIAINIAESCGTRTDPERARFLDIAMASVAETEYTLMLAFELGYMSDQAHRVMAADVVSAKRKLASLTSYLRGGTKSERKTARARERV